MIAAETRVTPSPPPRPSPRAARRPSARAATLAAVALLATVRPTAAGKEQAPRPEPIIEPNAVAVSPPYVVNGRAIELTMNGVQIRVEPLDENRRETWFALRTKIGGDPLPKRADYGDGFTVFEVSIANYSGATVTFSPAVASCWVNKDRDLRPIALDLMLDMLRAFHGSDVFDQAPLMREALSAFHLEPLLLASGQRTSRLLVYRGAPPGASELRLDLVNLEIGSGVIHPRFLFQVREPGQR